MNVEDLFIQSTKGTLVSSGNVGKIFLTQTLYVETLLVEIYDKRCCKIKML